MTDLPPYNSIKQQLQACRSKEETFKALVALSKRLTHLTAEEKTEENRVKGCESAVWLIIDNKDDTYSIKADSDAKLMRGVLVAILSLVQGKTKTERQKMDLKDELESLNLGSYLTQSRANGILAIIEKIKK
ncbi:Cysteine desulfuration protein SufE [Marinomonas spartinae]|uniref:SufE family protein n=1 Tax=Marinomonas spartinae TaxID=1792290 RepID=UPI000808FCBD|nr:SufE family protein [Marinomonas spartinae]SBS25122.1 Cysteine desulfuration protein SufE [Marinomonas spartinae]